MKFITAVLLPLFFCGALGVNVELLKPYNETAFTMFLAEDIDKDGVFTLDELHADFAKYDANGDGRESRHEYTTYICAVTPQLYQLSHYLYDEYDRSPADHHLEESDYDALFKDMDANGDNGVSIDEWINWWVAIFTKYEGSGNHQHGHSHEHGAHACM